MTKTKRPPKKGLWKTTQLTASETDKEAKPIYNRYKK